ncbi:MAG: DUF4157 domain-containing protein, partial [Chloroflexota bacterium]|nr:DUF4157 domain-containing protein [Chloroflexota bacterium]
EEEELMTKVQRQEEEEEVMMKVQRQEEEEEEVMMKASTRTPYISDSIEGRISAARGSGETLPKSVRALFEPHFGRDFNDVHIHTDTEADALSRQLNARAFTIGQDIFFRSGGYQPETEDGRKLLGHEMTHVVQQGGAPVSRKLVESEEETASIPKKQAEKELLRAKDKAMNSLTQASIKALLYYATICQKVGAEGVARYALDTAAGQALAIVKSTIPDIEIQVSTLKIAREVLEQLDMIQLLSEKDQTKTEDAVIEKVLDWALEQLSGSIRLMQQDPTQTTANVVAEKAALVQMLGGNPTAGIEALQAWAIESSQMEEGYDEVGMAEA